MRGGARSPGQPGRRRGAKVAVEVGAWGLWRLARDRDDDSPSLTACVALDVPLGVAVLVAAFLV